MVLTSCLHHAYMVLPLICRFIHSLHHAYMVLTSCLHCSLLVTRIMLAWCVQKAWAAEACATDPNLRMHPAAFEHKMSGSFYGNLKRKRKQRERTAAKQGNKPTVARQKRQRDEGEDEDLDEDTPAKPQKKRKLQVTRKRRLAESE